MKRKIRVYAIFALTIIGFFLPFVLVALGFAFSWTIAIVAGIVCEISTFCIFWSLARNILDLNDKLKIAKEEVEFQKELRYMCEDLYDNLVQEIREESK
mgnify:CR=1 FL=1